MKVSVKKKFWLLFLLVLLFLILSVLGIYYWELRTFRKDGTEQPAPEDSVAEEPNEGRGSLEPEMVDPQPGLVLASPTKEEYLEKSHLDREYSQVLSFFLPVGEPIKAVFEGRVTRVLHDQKPFPDDSAFSEIWVEREDGEIWASYIVVGEVLVKEGQSVARGEVLAKSGEGGLQCRSGANLSFRLHDKDSKLIMLSRTLFKNEY
ncbi:MAG: M23 family metallopeptidase [Patescibacteria group bacterium]